MTIKNESSNNDKKYIKTGTFIYGPNMTIPNKRKLKKDKEKVLTDNQNDFMPTRKEIANFVKRFNVPFDVANVLFFGIDDNYPEIDSMNYYFGNYNWFDVHSYINIDLEMDFNYIIDKMVLSGESEGNIPEYLPLNTKKEPKKIYEKISVSTKNSKYNGEYCINPEYRKIVRPFGLRPSFYSLDKYQRAYFIDFLKKPFEKAINISIAFLLYYNVERMLFTSKGELAYEFLIKLYNVNRDNNNFCHYVGSSLYSYCVNNSFIDKIKDLIDNNIIKCDYLSKIRIDKKITAEDIIENKHNAGWNNYNYIKKDRNKFIEVLEKIIEEQYGSKKIEVERIWTKDEIENFKKQKDYNYSFINFQNKSINSYNGLNNKKFYKIVYKLLKKTHNFIKNEKVNNFISRKKLMKCGMACTVIKYKNYNNIDVKFEDGTTVNSTKQKFEAGTIKNPKLEIDKKTKKKVKKELVIVCYIGRKNKMNCGELATVIEDFGYKDITVMFEDGTIRKHCRRDKFNEGKIAKKEVLD